MREHTFRLIHSLFMPLCLLYAIDIDAASIPIDELTTSAEPLNDLSTPPELIGEPTAYQEKTKNNQDSSFVEAQQAPNKQVIDYSSKLAVTEQDDSDKVIEYSLTSPLFKKTESPPNTDVIKANFNHLSEIMEEETLDDTIMIIKDLNDKLNRINTQIEQHLTSNVTDIFIMQNLFSASGEQGLLIDSRHSVQPVSTIANNQTHLTNELKTEATLYEKPQDFLDRLLKLPSFLFNIKNLIIFLGSIVLITGLLKALHVILNRID